MQDADEPVGEPAQCSVVVVAAARTRVVLARLGVGVTASPDSPSTRAPSNGRMPGWDKMLSVSPYRAACSGFTRVHGVAGGEQGGHPWGTVEPRARGVLGTTILWFELDRDSNGCPLPAERWLISQPRRDAGGYVLHRPAPPTGSDPIKARRGKSARCGRGRLVWRLSSPISQSAPGGQYFPGDRRRGQRFQWVWSSRWRPHGLA